jgi:hypothetical protein
VHGAVDPPIAELDRPPLPVQEQRKERPMSDVTFWDVVRNLLTGLQ